VTPDPNSENYAPSFRRGEGEGDGREEAVGSAAIGLVSLVATAPTFAPAGLDALVPGEVARKAETVGVTKAAMGRLDVFVLSVLAGAFIGLGAIFPTTVAAAGTELPYGVLGLLAGR
jgi:hypothetical protein